MESFTCDFIEISLRRNPLSNKCFHINFVWSPHAYNDRHSHAFSHQNDEENGGYFSHFENSSVNAISEFIMSQGKQRSTGKLQLCESFDVF